MESNDTSFPGASDKRNRLILPFVLGGLIFAIFLIAYFIQGAALNTKPPQVSRKITSTTSVEDKSEAEIPKGVGSYRQIFLWPGWPESGGKIQVIDDGRSLKFHSDPEENVLMAKNNNEISWLLPQGDFEISYSLETAVRKGASEYHNPFTRVYIYNRSSPDQKLFDSIYIRSRTGETTLFANDAKTLKEFNLGNFSYPKSGIFLLRFKNVLSSDPDVVEVLDGESGGRLISTKIPFEFFRTKDSKVSVAFEVGRGLDYMIIRDMVITMRQ